MNKILEIIENSFRKSLKGEENINNLIWYWGAISYVIAFLIAEKVIRLSRFALIDSAVSALVCAYFVWHIYALKKCSPKKPKLSDEEKKRLKEERKKDRGKRFMRKLLLQEPISNHDPVFITIVIDIFCISHFLRYLF